ncbi:MAG: DUF4396 domain-containing protein [Caulobacteraceae bacterium]
MDSLRVLAWLSTAGGAATALAIVQEVRVRPQKMGVMNIVWPITGLYAPLFGYFAYRTLGRPHAEAPGDQKKTTWRSIFLSSTHCGAGCVIGDVIGSFLALGLGLTLAGERMFAEFAVEFAFAYAVGIAFQFFPIRAMRKLPVRAALVAAVKADTVSLVAFEVGMFGWMALVALRFGWSFSPTSTVFWLLMQIGMLIGFATTYPANWLLIRTGVKIGM